ncbi:MAG: pirin family protein [Vicinamibacteria bacterium]|jgi:redox-sensitive bicupin YhaK (pirin superfamily)|nr:pirin family protein [Vicinamibacteria bacterium]MBP9948362.1 pirin family protein [Vicinamibacteria bacterium]
MSETIVVRRSEERGHANHGWLDTHHTFSFAGYYDPRHVGFRSLLVLNEDRVSPGKGFGKHPHADMEIISYVVSGALEHQDSMGTRAIMKAGDVQRISAGRGVRHSEFNASLVEPVHFLQIWIEPDTQGVTPDYAEKSFAEAPAGVLQLIASKGGRHDSISIHQDADVYVAKLALGQSFDHDFADGRAGWVQLIEGELTVNGETLRPGDGASISHAARVRLAAKKPAHFLFFDLR